MKCEILCIRCQNGQKSNFGYLGILHIKMVSENSENDLVFYDEGVSAYSVGYFLLHRCKPYNNVLNGVFRSFYRSILRRCNLFFITLSLPQKSCSQIRKYFKPIFSELRFTE